MPRFVILFHELPASHARASHYDLMLEVGGALWTWAMAQVPEPGKSLPAEKLADHRLAYLEYEGPISNDRGVVSRVDQGEFDLIEQSPERLVAALRGSRLRGHLTLAASGTDAALWSVTLEGT